MKKKIITVLFALLLISVLCLVAQADEYTEWTISSDGESLILDDTVYKLYEGYLFPSDEFAPEVKFTYGNKHYFSSLHRNVESTDILYVDGQFYVTENGKKALDDFIDGVYGEYKICDDYFDCYSNTSIGWINSLDGGTIKELNVRDLASVACYYVTGYDKTGSVAHIIGAIYDVGDDYYFINYDKLSNNYFDADGNFSYLRGTVNAYKLNTAQANDMLAYYENMQYFDIEKEESNDVKELSKGFFITVFVIITAIFGYIIPLIPAIIGAMKITKGTTQNTKRWLLILVLCGLWILLATGVIFAIIF